MTSRPELLPRTMSGSVVLEQLGFELMSVALVITEGHVDTWGLVRHLRQCWCLKAMLPPGPY